MCGQVIVLVDRENGPAVLTIDELIQWCQCCFVNVQLDYFASVTLLVRIGLVMSVGQD